MSSSDTAVHRPVCFVSHNLVNKLSVIIGNCDLVLEFDAGSEPLDPALRRRIEAIRAAAAEMARDVTRHICDLDGCCDQRRIGPKGVALVHRAKCVRK
jgi:hypothetical protein